MANELNFYGTLSQTGLTVVARVYDSAGAQVGSDVSCSESGSLAIYAGDMPTASLGQYGVRFFSGSDLLGQGVINWDGTGECELNLDVETSTRATQSSVDTVDGIVDDILVDTNELQTNQGNFATATGFSTPTDVTSAQTSIVAEIDANETKIDGLVTAVAAIPTTDSVADLTPVLTAISNLNDITTAQIRTELSTELARLDVAVSSVAYNDTALTALVNALPTLAEMEASSALTAIADITGLSTHSAADVVTAMNTVASNFQADVSAIETKVQADSRQALLIAEHDATQASISALNDFDPANDTVARVTLVDTTTANTDMRGTDGANTQTPLTATEVNAEVDTALADYDGPTKAELDLTQTAIISEINDNETKIDALTTTTSDVATKTDLTIVNEGVKKASLLIPHSDDLT